MARTLSSRTKCILHFSSRAFGANRSTMHFNLHFLPSTSSTFLLFLVVIHLSSISPYLYISSTVFGIFAHIPLLLLQPKQRKTPKYRTMVHQPDNPPVATIESGGPATSPTLEERPHDFRYEVRSNPRQKWERGKCRSQLIDN